MRGIKINQRIKRRGTSKAGIGSTQSEYRKRIFSKGIKFITIN